MKMEASQRLQLAQLAVASLSAHERTEFMRVLTGAPVAVEPDKILRPRGAAVRLGVTPRTVFNLLKAGALTRITLPGRQRGVGVRESEITAIVEGRAKRPEVGDQMSEVGGPRSEIGKRGVNNEQ